MANFEYKAVDNSGAAVTGTVTASDRRAAVADLAESGTFVTDLCEQSQASVSKDVSENIASIAKDFNFGSS
ncbi:MAG: hypothetical protein FVQ79_13810, partial [Planctomycetes bacterium]|nr:hypothetical protein [Planctomycetota bacterium]